MQIKEILLRVSMESCSFAQGVKCKRKLNGGPKNPHGGACTTPLKG